MSAVLFWLLPLRSVPEVVVAVVVVPDVVCLPLVASPTLSFATVGIANGLALPLLRIPDV